MADEGLPEDKNPVANPGPDVPKPDAPKPDDTTDGIVPSLSDEDLQDMLGDDIFEEETIESLRQQRDDLLNQVTKANLTIDRLTKEKEKLKAQLNDAEAEGRAALKRVEHRAEEQKAFAVEKLVVSELPVIDNLERAIAAVSAEDRAANPKLDKYATGVEKILTQLTAVFNKFGVKVINPLGEVCDPAKHEVVCVDETSTAPAETVVKVIEKGYELNGRVIRNAKVMTSPE